MSRKQHLAPVAVVACVISLFGLAVVFALPARAVPRHLVVVPAVALTTSVSGPTTAQTTRPAVPGVPRKATLAILPARSSSSAGPTDYSLIGYRRNPCQVVTVSTSGPDGGTIGTIVAELAAATGLRFSIVPSGGAITVAWANNIVGGEIGQTLWRSAGAWLTSATVAVDLVGTPFLGSVLRHELGHAVGLGHAGQSNDIMYPTIGLGSPTDYQAGDLAGLRAVGTAAGGC